LYTSRAASIRRLRGCVDLCFSSRRRHTRSKRDWSSDVCSSDLPLYCCASSTVTAVKRTLLSVLHWASFGRSAEITVAILAYPPRSEERRVGKEGTSRRWRGGESTVSRTIDVMASSQAGNRQIVV